MKSLFKKQVVSKLRDAFRVEALEPRVLLSADPILGVANLILPDDQHHDHVALDAYQPGQIGALEHTAVSYALVDQVVAASTTPAKPEFAVDQHTFDLADLAKRQGFMDGELVMAANDKLKGSGTLNVSILNTGTVAPGYSPGVQNVSSYTQTAGATLQIELGGTAPGTGYDQLNVANQATLDGKLEISLYNGFKPGDGEVFEFMHFGSVSGKFSEATGLVQVNDNIFFEVVQDATSLKLIAHNLDAITGYLIDTVGGDAADGIGYFLNNDYFPSIPPLTFTGTLNLDGHLFVDGQLTMDYETETLTSPVTGAAIETHVWTLGLNHGEGFLGLGGPAAVAGAVGLAIHDVNVGLAFVEPTSAGADYGWVLGHGVIGNVGVVGVAGLTISASNLAFDLSWGIGTLPGGLDNSTTLNLSAAPLSAGGYTLNDDGSRGEYLLVSGHADIAFGGLELNADIGLSVVGDEVLIAGSKVNAGFSAGGLAVGLADGAFGLVLGAHGGYAFEGTGSLSLVGGGFASVTASAAALRLNHLGEDVSGRTLQFAGDQAYTFGDLAANTSLEASATGLHATMGGVLDISGDFAFQKNSLDGAMDVVAQHANASMGAGAYGIGIADGTLGMRVGLFGTVLEARGALSAQLGSQVSLAADAVSVRWNDTLQDFSDVALDAGGLAYVFGAGLMASLKEVAVGGASLQVGGFIQANGSFTVRRSAGNQVTLADGSTVTVDELTFGASGINVFAGVEGGSSDALGVQMNNVNLALVMMSQHLVPSRTWTALAASADSAGFVGLDAFALAATDIKIDYNRAGNRARPGGRFCRRPGGRGHGSVWQRRHRL